MKKHAWLGSLTLIGLLVTAAPRITYAVDQPHPPTRREVKQLIATARTPEDHQHIAAFYREEAKRFAAQAKEHQEMADAYYRDPASHAIPKYPTLGQHCRDLTGYLTNAAKQSEALASLHEQMAKDAAK